MRNLHFIDSRVPTRCSTQIPYQEFYTAVEASTSTLKTPDKISSTMYILRRFAFDDDGVYLIISDQ